MRESRTRASTKRRYSGQRKGRKSVRTAWKGGDAAILLAILLTAPVASFAQQDPAAGSESIARPQEMALADFFVNGENRGTIEFVLSEDGRPFVPAQTIRDALAGITRPRTIEAVAGRERLVAADELGLVGIRLSYDPAALVLRLDVEPRAMQPVDLSLRESEKRESKSGDLEPESLALILGLSLQLDPTFARVESEEGFSLLGKLGFEPSVNLFDFVALGSADLQYDDGFSFVLNEAKLVRDFPGIGFRVEGGIVDAKVASFQSGSELLGLALRRESELPGGRGGIAAANEELILERAADVTIEVNGTVARELRLAPGSYKLSELPLASGLNEVLVTIREKGEEPRIIRLGIPFDSEILEAGELDYSINLGVDRATLSKPFGSGYLSVGIGRILELGLDAEAGFGGALGGLSASWASPIGTIGASSALSFPYVGESAFVPAYAARASWRFSAISLRFLPRLGLAAQYRSPGFSPPQEDAPAAGTSLSSWTFSGQIGETLPAKAGSFSLFGDATMSGEVLRSASLSSALFLSLPGTISASLSAGVGWSLGSGFAPRASISLVFSQPDRPLLQYRHDMITGEDGVNLAYSLDKERRHFLGMRATGLVGAEIDRTAGFSVQSSAGPFALAASGDYSEYYASGMREYGGNFSASTAIALAGGHLAAASSFGNAFAILVPATSLGGERVELRPSNGAAVAAEGGKMALVGGLRPYWPYKAVIEMPESPPDIRPDPEAVKLVPGYRSITIIKVRAAAAMAVHGRLVDEEGRPLALLTGDLLDEWGGKKAFAGTFTDEGGVFECYGLESGAQAILWGDGRMSRFMLTDSEGIGTIELGEVRALMPASAGGASNDD